MGGSHVVSGLVAKRLEMVDLIDRHHNKYRFAIARICTEEDKYTACHESAPESGGELND